MKKMTFVQAMRDYFGQKPGQSLQEFAAELNKLSETDKAWFRANLPSVGYELTT